MIDPPAIIQIIDDRPTVSESEARPIVQLYVDKIARDAKECCGNEISSEKKAELVEGIIQSMKEQGSYRFVK